MSAPSILSDCLTKQGVKPDALIRAVEAGILPEVDTDPMFRTQLHAPGILDSMFCWPLLWPGAIRATILFPCHVLQP